MASGWATGIGVALDHSGDVPLGVQLDWGIRVDEDDPPAPSEQEDAQPQRAGRPARVRRPGISPA